MAVETERPHVACAALVLALLVKQGVLLSRVLHSSRRTSPAGSLRWPPLVADRGRGDPACSGWHECQLTVRRRAISMSSRANADGVGLTVCASSSTGFQRDRPTVPHEVGAPVVDRPWARG